MVYLQFKINQIVVQILENKLLIIDLLEDLWVLLELLLQVT